MIERETDYYAILVGNKAYCIECGLEIIGRDEVWLALVAKGEADITSETGQLIELLHPDSIQYEACPDDFFPDGLYCCRCKEELIMSVEGF